jgi:hypothetical protein
MMLSADDEVTLVELGVIVLGIALTWALYRHAERAAEPTGSGPGPHPPADEISSARENQGQVA